MTTWYEVTGRGSGRKLDGVHQAHTDRPYGQMMTLCGVGISAAFPVKFPKPWQHRCKQCAKAEKRSSDAV